MIAAFAAAAAAAKLDEITGIGMRAA